MGYLLETVDERKLANQQDVVRNERAQHTENVPYGIVTEAVYQTLFPKGHPYYGNVIGSHADIQAAKLVDVKAFFKQYYAPNNASLSIVGDIDKAKTKALVEKYFGSLKRGPDVPKTSVQTPPVTAERRAVSRIGSRCRACTWPGTRRRSSRPETPTRASDSAPRSFGIRAGRRRHDDS
jgi:zinc protease